MLIEESRCGKCVHLEKCPRNHYRNLRGVGTWYRHFAEKCSLYEEKKIVKVAVNHH